MVTSSPGAVIALSQTDDTAAVILNGRVHSKSLSVVGPSATKMVSRLRADIAFIEVDAFDSGTRLCTFHPETVPIKKAMIRNASTIVAVLKPQIVASTTAHMLMHSFGSFADIDVLVTDSDFTNFPVLPNHNIQVVTP